MYCWLVLSRVLLTRLQPFKTDKKWRKEKRKKGGRQREKRERERKINIQILAQQFTWHKLHRLNRVAPKF